MVEKDREDPSCSAGKKAAMLRLNDLSHMSLECGGCILATFQDLDVFILILPIGRCRSAGAEI